MLSLRSAGLLALSNVLLLIAIITFAIGFYPHKSTLSGIARATDSDQLDFADSPFDKLIFVVVDALRR